MAANTQRIEIGFEGGPVIALQIEEKALEDLRGALAGGGWQRVPTEGGDVDVDLGRVVFVKTASGSTKVGF